MSTVAYLGRAAGYLADPLYLLILPYIALQPVFRKFVQKTDIYEKNKTFYKKVMAYYNVVMAVFSLVSCLGMAACCVAIAWKGEFELLKERFCPECSRIIRNRTGTGFHLLLIWHSDLHKKKTFLALCLQ